MWRSINMPMVNIGPDSDKLDDLTIFGMMVWWRKKLTSSTELQRFLLSKPVLQNWSADI